MDFNNLNFEFEKIKISENSFEKFRINKDDLVKLLIHLQVNPEFLFDRLNSIIAIDLGNDIELIYDLYSTCQNVEMRISVLIDSNNLFCPSVVDIYNSAYFDECEIYDLFGVTFTNNPDLKRLLMPKGWIGHPLRKDYVFEDKRLSWSVK